MYNNYGPELQNISRDVRYMYNYKPNSTENTVM